MVFLRFQKNIKLWCFKRSRAVSCQSSPVIENCTLSCFKSLCSIFFKFCFVFCFNCYVKSNIFIWTFHEGSIIHTWKCTSFNLTQEDATAKKKRNLDLSCEVEISNIFWWYLRFRYHMVLIGTAFSIIAF